MKSIEHQCLDFWRSKPADEKYDYRNVEICALGQFASLLGSKGLCIGFLDQNEKYHVYPIVLRRAAYRDNDVIDLTFGAAANRLEKLFNAEKEPTESVA